MVQETSEVVEAKTNKGVGKTPIDIIIPAHNHLGLTIKCIDALYKYTISPFHLIVVCDSTDLTPLYFAQLLKQHDNITYLHHDVPYKTGNQFFNEALTHCKYEFVATVMNSMTVEPDWELVGIEILKSDPKIATIGLKCLFPWGTIESAGISFNAFIPTDIGVHLPAHRLSSAYEVQAVQWAFAIHRKAALIGNLEDYTFHGFVGWDDIDNCFVLRKKGWKILYSGVGVGYHEPRASRGRDDEEGGRLNRENAVTFWKRWGYWEQYPQCHNLNLNGRVELIPQKAEPIKPNRAQRRRVKRETAKCEPTECRSAGLKIV